MRFYQILATLLALLTFSAAWPWPPSLPDVQALRRVENFLGKRQGGGGNNNNNDNNQSSQSSQSSTQAPTDTITGGSSSTQSSDSSSGSATPPPKSGSTASQTSSGGDSSSTDGSSTNSTQSATSSLASITVGAAGAINMITPNPTVVATQYYSVGSTVTWAWNYTNLPRPPQYIDVVASMSGSANQAVQTPLTLTANMTWASTQNFTWDTNAYQSQTPLGVGIYALLVYDADAPGGTSATVAPGHLGANANFNFGLYTGQPYTALANPYVCATCNAAASIMQPSVLKMAVGTAALTIGSFVYFAGGWGVFM